MAQRSTVRTSSRSNRVQAWVAVLVIGGLALLAILVLAFSTDNTPASIDGNTATTSSDLG